MQIPRTILFVSNKNSIRSPIAAAIVRQKLEGKIRVDACGLEKDELNPFAFGVCEEVGLSLIPHTAKTIDEMPINQYDLVIAMSPESAGVARSKIMSISGKQPNLEFWMIGDPSHEDGTRQVVLNAFRACRDDIERRIKTRFSDIWPQY